MISNAHLPELETGSSVSLLNINTLHFMWFEVLVTSRELGFGFPLLVWPFTVPPPSQCVPHLLSPSRSPLSAFVSVPLLQRAMPANEHWDRAIIQPGASPCSPARTRCSCTCGLTLLLSLFCFCALEQRHCIFTVETNRQRRIWTFPGRRRSFICELYSLGGEDELLYPFQT